MSVIFKEQGTSNNLVSLRSPECALYRLKTVACTVSEKYTEICCPHMRPQGLKRIRRSDLNSEWKCQAKRVVKQVCVPAGEQSEGSSARTVTVAATIRLLSSDRCWGACLTTSVSFIFRWGRWRTKIKTSSSIAANTRDFPGSSSPVSPPSPSPETHSSSPPSSAAATKHTHTDTQKQTRRNRHEFYVAVGYASKPEKLAAYLLIAYVKISIQFEQTSTRASSNTPCIYWFHLIWIIWFYLVQISSFISSDNK